VEGVVINKLSNVPREFGYIVVDGFEVALESDAGGLVEVERRVRQRRSGADGIASRVVT